MSKHEAVQEVGATELLRQDHERLRELFNRFEGAEGGAREGIVDQVVQELQVHARLEEELFYPALRERLSDAFPVSRAQAEHGVAEALIAEIHGLAPESEERIAKFLVLVEEVRRHLQAEEEALLPLAEQSELDLEDLGLRMTRRKAELLRSGWGPSRKVASGAKARRERARTTARRSGPREKAGPRAERSSRGRAKEARY